jgi:uncharacterized DUF497 family protein
VPFAREATRATLDYMYDCAYIRFVDFEWDPRKAAVNLRKHRIDFADAATVLHDDFAITIADGNSVEERFVTLGMDALGRVLVVVFTWRGARARVISARRAGSHERRRYQEGP